MTWTLQKSAVDPYLNICKLAATKDDYFSNFKNIPHIDMF